MKKQIQDILVDIRTEEILGSVELYVSALAFDSRKVTEGTVFFAIKGTQADGHLFIDKAVEQGAAAVVCSEMPSQTYKNVTYIKVSDTSKALGQAAARFFDNPSQKIKMVGVTGTNGKTTTATLLYRLFMDLGHKSGLISTVKNYIGTEELDTKHTTPDVLTINELLCEMIEQGCGYCFAEVSSHALAQGRVEGLTFTGGIFTNLTHDHLDFHKTFADYLKTKKTFFDNLPVEAFALTNIDDKNGNVMLQNTQAKRVSYGVKKFADFKAKAVEIHIDGMLCEINGSELWTILIGDFNVYNILAVYGTAELLGLDSLDILQGISQLQPVKGRFEIINKNNKTVIVDYAHTPDALKNVLATIRKFKRANQNVITVVGAGGDRDKTKRPVMASVAAASSERLILTSDNPRTENPETILADMEAGLSEDHSRKTLKITSREEGIKTALMLAQDGDIILIAGKGHENYQEINGVRAHFDDREMAEKYL